MIGFCGAAGALVFLRPFLRSYYDLEVYLPMKRIIPLCLALIMTVGLLAGCGKQNEQKRDCASSPRFSPNTIGSEKFSVTRRITPK